MAGTALLLALVFDSGILGDAAQRELGDRAGAAELGRARERLGMVADFRADALRVRLEGPPRRLLLQAGAEGLAIRDVAGQEFAVLPLDGNLGDLAAALGEWRDGEHRLVAEVAPEPSPTDDVEAGPGADRARGLVAGTGGAAVTLDAGREAAALGWARAVPAWQRVGARVLATLTLDFGADRDGRPVVGELGARGLRSLMLSLPAFVLTTLSALALALLCTVVGGRVDRGFAVTAALAVALPSLAWVLVLRGVFAFGLGWFPVRPWGAPVLPLLVLPVVIWTLIAVWPDLRLYRTLAREQAEDGWLRAARARGLGRRRLMFGHLLPALAAPVLTRVAVTLPFLFTGSLLLEHLFAIPGLGGALVEAVQRGDENLLRATTFLFAVGFLLAQWLADALAAACDPRDRRSVA